MVRCNRITARGTLCKNFKRTCRSNHIDYENKYDGSRFDVFTHDFFTQEILGRLDPMAIIKLAATSKLFMSKIAYHYEKSTRLSTVFAEIVKRDLGLQRQIIRDLSVPGCISVHYKTHWFSIILSNHLVTSRTVLRLSTGHIYQHFQIEDEADVHGIVSEFVSDYIWPKLTRSRELTQFTKGAIQVSWVFTQKPKNFEKRVSEIQALKYNAFFSKEDPTIVTLFLEAGDVIV